MNSILKDKLVGMFLNGLEDRDPRSYVSQLSGEDCVEAHNLLHQLDMLLKGQWFLMGAPNPEEIR